MFTVLNIPRMGIVAPFAKVCAPGGIDGRPESGAIYGGVVYDIQY